MLSRPLTALALVGVAATSLGCQNEANNGSGARGALAGFLRTCNRGQGPLAQQLVVPAARGRFVAAAGTEAGCATVLGLDPGTSLGGVRIARVSAGDGRGQAVIVVGAARVRIDLALTRDGWRIEGSS